MAYCLLGRSGILVSPLCLGTMNFGGPTTEDDLVTIMQKAMDAVSISSIRQMFITWGE